MDTSDYVMDTYINVMAGPGQSGPARAPRPPSASRPHGPAGATPAGSASRNHPGTDGTARSRASPEPAFLALGERRPPGDALGGNRDERRLPVLVDDRARQVAARRLHASRQHEHGREPGRLWHDGHRQLGAGGDRRDGRSSETTAGTGGAAAGRSKDEGQGEAAPGDAAGRRVRRRDTSRLARRRPDRGLARRQADLVGRRRRAGVDEHARVPPQRLGVGVGGRRVGEARRRRPRRRAAPRSTATA